MNVHVLTICYNYTVEIDQALQRNDLYLENKLCIYKNCRPLPIIELMKLEAGHGKWL